MSRCKLQGGHSESRVQVSPPHIWIRSGGSNPSWDRTKNFRAKRVFLPEKLSLDPTIERSNQRVVEASKLGKTIDLEDESVSGGEVCSI